VVVQNFRPGVVDRLGIGYEAAHARRTDVVYVSISGYGPDGPLADLPIYDPIIQAIVGVVARQQSQAIPLPDLVRNVMIDKATGLTAAQAICAALVRRARTGNGDHLVIPMLDVGVYFFWPDGMADFTFVGDGAEPGARVPDSYQLTHCADGQLVYFTGTVAQLFGVYRVVGHPEMAHDERYNAATGTINPESWEHIDRVVRQAFSQMSVCSAVQALQDQGVPAAPVNQPHEVMDHPQVVHNQSLHTWEHPGAGTLRQPRHPVRFTSSSTPVPEFVDDLGEHTDEILRQLGRSATQIDELRSGGIVA
jgi:crotonobetainyl-CoA:carnitine CoA-transferase CaiB-like acyl-CoA transferase